jgi:hypothetical protein
MKTFKQPEGMHVPEGYFARSKSALLDIPNALEEKPKTPRVKPLFTYLGISLAVAATLTALYFNLFEVQQTPSFDSLDKDLVVDYLWNESTDPGYAPLQYTSFWEETALGTESELNLNEEQLEDYLLEQEDVIFDNI